MPKELQRASKVQFGAKNERKARRTHSTARTRRHKPQCDISSLDIASLDDLCIAAFGFAARFE